MLRINKYLQIWKGFFVLRWFFFSLLLLNKNLAICSGKRREEQEKKRKKKTSCLCTNWLGRSWRIWWPITDMTSGSANFKMSETGESKNLPECTMEETPPPCCTTDTEDCHKSSQVIIQIHYVQSFYSLASPLFHFLLSFSFNHVLFSLSSQHQMDNLKRN